MKSDPEELPRIRFQKRDARIHKHRHRHRKRSDEKPCVKVETSGAGKPVGHHSMGETSNTKEPPRIPPLPDLSLFNSDTQMSNRFSVPTPERPKKAKKAISARKKRQSIESIKTKEREILGDLFAVDKESSDSDCYVTCTRNKFGDFVKHIRQNKKNKNLKHDIQKGNKSQSDKKERNVNSCSKSNNSSGVNISKSVNSENIKYDKQEPRSGILSAKSVEVNDTIEGKGNEIPAGESKSVKDLATFPNRKLIFPLHNPVHIDDKSDTCHQISARAGPFDLLSTLDKNYKQELQNLQISPRSRQAMKDDCIPIVKIQATKPQPVSSQIISLESELGKIQTKKHQPTLIRSTSSESESDNEKSRRHFTDVFSDISETDTDVDVEKTDYVDETDTTITFSENFYNEVLKDDAVTHVGFDDIKKFDGKDKNDHHQEIDQGQENLGQAKKLDNSLNSLSLNETLCLSSIDKESDTSFKPLNYFVKSDQFSDISEDDDNQKQGNDTFTGASLPNISEVDAFVNASIERGEISGNSTLIIEEDASVINSSSDTLEDNVEETPVLEKAQGDRSKTSLVNFEMPILEKYSEVYSNFRSGLDDQEILPDLSDDEIDDKGNDMPPPLAPENEKRSLSIKSSSQCDEINKTCDNVFMKLSLNAAKSSVTFSSNSPFVPVLPGSSKSKSPTPSLKSSASAVVLSSPKQCSTPKSRKRKFIRKSSTCPSFNSSKLFNSSVPSVSSANLEMLPLDKQVDQLNSLLEDFLDINDRKLPPPKIPEAQKNIVYGCEEEGILSLGHALNFVEHFCKQYIITSDLCSDIIKAAFHSECKLSQMHWAFNLLSELNMKRRAEIEMNWDTINQCLTVALSPNREKPYYQLLQSTLLLQLGVEVLKMDLYSRDVSDNRQIRKSYAYKMFAYDVSTGNRKNLMYYLNRALHAGQCQTMANEEAFQLPNVLPMLQDLFALCVDVSSSCMDCANMLAADMVNTYKFLHNLADKQLLIKSISSHLLRYKLVQQVLESQYDCNQTLGGAFPDCLEDVIQCFFKVMPLKNPLTPPTTPNDDLFGIEESHRFAADATEEIAILLYFIVVSYLHASKEKLYMALRLRVNLTNRKKKLRSEDVLELTKMKEHVQELEYHLRGMTPDLSENTEHYLYLMSCLGDLGQMQE